MKSAIHVADFILQVSDGPAPDMTHAQPARCLHRWPSGRRCRKASESASSSFRATHAAVEHNRHGGDRAEVLLANSDSLHSAEGIHNSLAELYVMVAEDKISPRRAAVLAYISHIMLRTLQAVEQTSPQVILDLPRPRHDNPPDPEDIEVPAAIAHNAGPHGDRQARPPEPPTAHPQIHPTRQTPGTGIPPTQGLGPCHQHAKSTTLVAPRRVCLATGHAVAE